ncbi:MAG: hypothetical protein H0T42_13970 [Deltaproteobacteria bacterium]|nr:hypothetical protein [Deltaproteobacteria bacterium]
MTVVTPNYDLEVVVTYSGGSSLAVSILGPGGAVLSNGTPNGPSSLRTLVANLPTGTYYAQVSGSTTGTYSIMLRSQP